MRKWTRLREVLGRRRASNDFARASRNKQGRVEVELTESFSAIRNRQPTMRHTRRFSNTSSRQILSLLLGLKFYGAGGLMVDSTADSEGNSPDGLSRFIKNFRPLGNRFGSVLAGSFGVSQEFIECSEGAHGVKAIIRMSFSPANSRDQEPSGSFLWLIESAEANKSEMRTCWTELINTDETRGRQITELRIKAGAKWAFQLGHNRLIRKAAQRIAEILNAGNDSEVALANNGEADRLNFSLNQRGHRRT